MVIVTLALAGCSGGFHDAPTDDAPFPKVEPRPLTPINGSTHFEFGPSLGCTNDPTGGPPACVSFIQGPDAQPVDGFWIPIDASYWRHTFSSTIDSATNDSDCVLVAKDATTILDMPFRGFDPCGGTVVDGTAYIFLYPFGETATAMTLTFDEEGGG